jgi:hypothetical protein
MRMSGFVAVLATVLSGCETTDPGDGAGIQYYLPKTDAALSVGLTLSQCDNGGYKIGAEGNLSGVAGAQTKPVYIDGKLLVSSRIKRTLHIAVNDSGVISSINSDTGDRTAAIIGNVLKAIVSFLPLVTPAATRDHQEGDPQCKDDVVAALARVRHIPDEITGLRNQLAGGNLPPRAERQAVARIDALAREMASLQTGILRIDTPPLALDLSPSEQEKKMSKEGDITLPADILKKWIKDEKAADGFAKRFKIHWSASEKDESSIKPMPEHLDKSTPAVCRFSIPVPAVKLVSIMATGSDLLDGFKGSSDLPVAQWADPAQLCIDARLGESRTVAVTFDSFGRRTDFSWTAEATGETISGALAGIAPDAASVIGAIRGPSELARDKAELDRLQTQQQLNQLRRCKAILDAGGFDCNSAPAM